MRLGEHRLREQGFPDLVLYDSLVAPGVCLLQDGSLMVTWRYRGPDMESRTHTDMAALSARLNSILRLGSGWMVHCDAIRSHAPGYVDSEFPFPVAALIDQERRLQFLAEGAHYESSYYLTLTHQPAAPTEAKLRKLVYEIGNDGDSEGATKSLAAFSDRIAACEGVLSSLFEIERLGPQGVDGIVYDEQLRYLRRTITGDDHPFRLPDVPSCLQDIVGAAAFVAGLEPKVNDKHLAVVAIDGFPQLSQPGILGALDELPLEYRWSTRAIELDPNEAYARLSAARKKWNSRRRQWMDVVLNRAGVNNEFAAKMTEDALSAAAEASSGDVYYVVYTSLLVLRDENRAALADKTALVVKTIRNLGFGCRVERENAIEAFRGSLPGDGYCNIRRQYLHTLNLADLLPITSVFCGATECPSRLMPPHSPPVLYAATSGQTPFRFHLHVSDLGHQLVIGPSGAGKSLFLALLAAQWFRFPDAQVYAFDKGFSLFTLTEACRGEFYDIGSDEQPMSFQPLGCLDLPSDRDWACSFVEQLCELHGLALSPQQRNSIRRGIELLAGAPPSRTITELTASIQESQIQAVLLQYIGGPIDAATDEVGRGRFITYEIGALLEMDSKIVAPILSYLFRRIARRLQEGKGAPTLILLDEAWAPLKLPRFQAEVRTWLKTLRKLNAVVVMATQHLGDITSSPIGDVILNSCPTRILLPDAEAGNPAVKRLYADALGLNDRELELVQNGTPKRDYFVYSADWRGGRRMIQLGMGPVGLAFTGVSGKGEIEQVRAMIARYGEDWPAEWLRVRGAPQWADYLASASQEDSQAAGVGR